MILLIALSAKQHYSFEPQKLFTYSRNQMRFLSFTNCVLNKSNFDTPELLQELKTISLDQTDTNPCSTSTHCQSQILNLLLQTTKFTNRSQFVTELSLNLFENQLLHNHQQGSCSDRNTLAMTLNPPLCDIDMKTCDLQSAAELRITGDAARLRDQCQTQVLNRESVITLKLSGQLLILMGLRIRKSHIRHSTTQQRMILIILILMQLCPKAWAPPKPCETCDCSKETITLICRTPSTQTYVIGGPTMSAPVTLTSSGNKCVNSDVNYNADTVTSSTGSSIADFYQVSSIGQTSWYSTNLALDGAIFTVKQNAYLDTGRTPIATKTCTNTVQFVKALGCSTSPETITISAIPASFANQNYIVTNSQGSITLQFVENSIYCVESDITKSMTVTTSGPSFSFITFDLATNVVAWQTNSNAQSGTYTIRITAKIVAIQTWTKTVSFTLTVTASCLASTETIIITAGTPLGSKNYVVGNTQTSLIISQFTENSIYCTQSDIDYSMTVTPPLGITTTSFISFNPSTRVVEWYTLSETQVGTYTITITGQINAVSNFTQSTSFTLFVYNCANSPETITITPGTSPGAKTYTIGAAAASIVFAAFTENSAACTAADILYSITITPSTAGLSTQFITFNQATRSVSWYTNDTVQAGSYTITITGEIVAASTWNNSMSFVLTLEIAQCNNTVDNTLVLTPSTAPASQTYTVGDPLVSLQIDQFNLSNAVICLEQDIVYSMTVSPSVTFISFDATNRIVSWSTPSNTNAYSNYIIKIFGQVQTSLTAYSSNFQFNLAVVASCKGSTDTFTLITSSVLNQMYITSNPTGSYTVAAFTENGLHCTAADIVYTMSVTPLTAGQSTAFIILNSTTRLASWETSSPSDVGSFKITITGTISTYSPTTHTASNFYTLSVQIPSCATLTETIQIVTSSAPANQNYTIGATASSVAITEFTENSTLCTQADIVYSMIITPATVGTPTTFITFDPNTLVVSWSTALMSQVGSYTIVIQAKITTTSVWSQSVQFVLTVEVTCATSTENNQIFISTAPASQIYTVGANLTSLTIASFTVTSIVCTQADIVYQMRVTPATLGLPTSFITFENLARTVTWFTNSNTQTGIYQIYIDGSINAATLWNKTVSFTLTVKSNCAFSNETIEITTGTPLTDQLYFLGDPLATLIISQFIQNSTYCSQSDISYSMTVTPLTQGLSTAFIKFTATTRKITWQTVSQAQVGKYTITVLGQITAATIFSNSTSFTLTVPVNACPYTYENFVITPSSGTAKQTYLIGSNQGWETILPFTLNSTHCRQSDIVYTMDITPSNGLSFIQFNSTALKVTWQTTDIMLAGVYDIVVTGTVTSTQIVSKSTTFTFVAWIFTEPKVLDQEYTANSQLLEITTGSFLVMPSSYQNTVIVNKPVAYLASFKMTAPLDQTQLLDLPSWIQYQQGSDGSGVFSILSNGKDLKDSYIIAIVLQFSNSQQTLAFTQFNLKIKQVVNQPPVFQTSLEPSYNLTCSSVLQLPEFSDPEMTPVALTFFFGSQNFLQGDQYGAIQIEKVCPTGTFLVSVALTDQDGYKSQYSFKLVLSQQQANSNSDEMTQQNALKALEFASIFGEKNKQPQRNQNYISPKIVGAPITIQSVSNTGLATFKFGSAIIVPSFNSSLKSPSNRMLLQLEEYISKKILSLRMSNQEGNEVALTNWTAVNLTESFLKVQIVFKSPIDVSTQETDFLKAKFLNADIFVLKNGKGFLLNDPSELVTKATIIPPQFLSQAAAEAAQKQIESFQSASYTTITITLIIQLLGKKLISFVWLFFCAIQVVIFLNQHVNYNLPATAITTITALHDIISLNAFNKDEALEKIGAKDITKSPLFSNLGGIAFLAVIVVIAIIILGIMIKFCKKPFCQRLINKIKAMLLWNFVIRYFYAVFLNFLFSSIVSLKSEDAKIAEIVISSFILTALLSVVFAFTRLLVQLDSSFLEMSNVKRSFGMLYTNLKTQKLSTRLYNQTFFVQRMALVFIVAFKLDFGIQAGLLQLAILMHTIYLLGVRPYQTMECALPDILNEVFLILAVMLLICLSPWQTDNILRYQVGQALAALIGLFFVLNFGVIFFRLGSDTYRKACLKIYKNKVKKQHNQIIKERKAEIERRLRKIAKKSGLVQFTKLDDVNDPRPHINQIPFTQVINTNQMFQQIEKISLERALINSNNGAIQISNSVKTKNSKFNEKDNNEKPTLNSKKSKAAQLINQVLEESDSKAISKTPVQNLNPEKISLQKDLKQKQVKQQKIIAPTKSRTLKDQKNLQQWNLISEPPYQQTQLVNTVKQIEKTNYSQYLEFMDRQFEQKPHKQPIQLRNEDKNEQNYDSYNEWYKNYFGYSEESLIDSSPVQLPSQTPIEQQNPVLNQPIRILRDRKEIRTQDLKKKPFESQLVFTEAKVKHQRFTSKATQFRNNHNDDQQDKPIWLQN